MRISPQQRALEILEAWTNSHREDERLPVNCSLIAKEFNIHVIERPLEIEFVGGLFIEDGQRAIIINSNIDSDGRKNFTLAHELGHYFVHTEQLNLKCTIDDLADTSPHSETIEKEANVFASTLLIPAGDLRKQLDGNELTLNLASQLSHRYSTSLTSTVIRICEITKKPLTIIYLKNNKVSWWNRNNKMKFSGLWLTKGQDVGSLVSSLSENGSIIDPTDWLNEERSDKWELMGSSIDMPNYSARLVMIEGIER